MLTNMVPQRLFGGTTHRPMPTTSAGVRRERTFGAPLPNQLADNAGADAKLACQDVIRSTAIQILRNNPLSQIHRKSG